MKTILFYLFSIFLTIIFLIPKPSFAQDAPCNATGSVCGQTAYDTCTPICLGRDAAYSCYQASNPNCQGQILCGSENSRCTQPQTPISTPKPKATPTPTPALPSPSNCATDCNKCPTITTCGTKTYDTCIDDKFQISMGSGFCQNGATKFRCYAKENNNCVSNSPSSSNEFIYSCFACNSGGVNPSASPFVSPSTNPSESPTPKKPVRIIISQFERPDQILDPSANLNEAKINLNFDDKGVANVRFQVNYDLTGQDVAIYYIQYKLKQKPAENISPTENQTKEVKVLNLKYFPLDSSNSRLDPQITNMNNNLASIRAHVDSITGQGLEKLTQASRYHGYKINSPPALKYELAQNFEYLEPLPISQNKVPWSSSGSLRPDYNQLLNKINICDWVDNKGISQVWLWGYHTKTIEPAESDMSMGTDSQAFWNHGAYGDVSNSEQSDDLPTCRKTYVLYNYNYERGLGELLENHGHHIEAVMSFIDYDLFENKFVKPHGNTSRVNNCGWMHAPPNIPEGDDYNWISKNRMLSTCEDWQPLGDTSASKLLNCEAWYGPNCKDNGGVEYKVWWMQNLPGMNNPLTYKGNKMRNWWAFIGDFDTAITAGKSLVVKSARITLQSVNSSNEQSDSNYIPPASLPHPSYPPNTSIPQVTPVNAQELLQLIDFNGDGKINVYDYIIFARKKVGF